MRLRIKYKILLLVLSVSVAIYLVSIGYIMMTSRRVMLDDAYEKVQLSATNSASKVTAGFESYMSVVRTLAGAFSDYNQMPPAEWQRLFLDLGEQAYRGYPDILSLWDCFEFRYWKPGYTRPYGRIYHQYFHNERGQIVRDTGRMSLNGDPAEYAHFKKMNTPCIWEPYQDISSVELSMRTLMTTIGAPIQCHGEYAGMVGCDFSLGWLQDLAASVKPYDRSQAFLLSHAGTIAAHPVDSLLMQPLEVLFPPNVNTRHIHEVVEQGKAYSFTYTDSTGVQYYVHLSPIAIKHSATNWSLGISVPLSVITASADSSMRIALTAGLIAIVLLTLVLIRISDWVARPIVRMTESLRLLGRGEIDEGQKLNIHTGDEIEWMSRALNSLIDGLQTKNTLAQSIGSGDLSCDIALLSEKDTLGKSLVAMRNGLRKARQEQEAREQENAQRAWANAGVTRFSVLLRQNTNDLNVLCEVVLHELVRYVGANVGALYLRDDEAEEVHEQSDYVLRSSFAWDRKRYLEARYPLGIGLVGACAMEKAQSFITDIPADYGRIAAGVGDARPRCIVMQPLLHEGEAIGVLELAAFDILEPYVLEFLQTISNPIAASLFTVRVGTRTTMLLQQTREQAEELSAQEEELRQNLEEITTTQEESERRNQETENLMRALSSMLYYVEFNRNGIVTNVSQNYLNRLQRPRELFMDTYFSDDLNVKGWAKPEYDAFWKELTEGKSKHLDTTIIVNGREIALREYYVPISSFDGKVEKIIRLSFEL